MLYCIGDLHLDAHKSYAPNLYKQQLRSLRNAFRLIVKEGGQEVFLLGDVFDKPHPPNYLVIALRRLLYKFRDHLHIHIVVGNHDWESTEHHSLQWYEDLAGTGLFNFTVYTEPQVIKLAGMKLFVCPHPFILDAPAKVDWCLGHFAWNGASADNGFMLKNDNAPKGRWVLGDLHMHQSGNRYVYAGSLTQILWDEKLPKGILRLDADDWEFVPIKPTYELDSIEVAKDEDLRAVTPGKLWQLRTVGDYVLPSDFKRKHHEVIDIKPARRRKDLRSHVLLQEEDTKRRKPLRILKDYVSSHKLGLRQKEIKYAMAMANRLFAATTRK